MSKTTFTVNRADLSVVMERVFDAPREAVFKAYTDPEAIPKWWGLRVHTTIVDTMDVRVGGAWRYVCRGTDGQEYAFHGVYTQIDPPRLLSCTFNFEGIPGDHELLELLQTVTFEDTDGKTKVTSTAAYARVEDLDGMIESGMESGAVETWERLAELVEKTQRSP